MNTTQDTIQLNFKENHFTNPGFPELLKSQPITNLICSGSPKITLSENPETHMEQLRGFHHLLQLMDIWGNIEHSSDWDPYLIITLKSGQVIQTNDHYYQYNFSPDNHYILLEDYTDEFQDDEDYYQHDLQIPITDIQSIQVIS